MNIINIRIEDRLPKAVAVSATAVSDNEFRFVFEFDDAWDADALKTIWIVYGDGEYETYPITGNELEVMLGGWPYINIGASQGTKLASRPCKINIQGSIKQLVDEGAQMPSEDQWDTIIEMINQFPGALEAASRAEAAAAESAENLEKSKKVLANVNTAGETQVKAVQDEGAVQIGNVEDARDVALDAVAAAAAAQKEDIAALDAVQFGPQNKTDAEKRQARTNIGAAGMDVYAYIDDAVNRAPRYGVSGVGGSNPTLTRLWDAVGLTAMVGTDTESPSYRNDFDDLQPFARRKCVGWWSQPDDSGKAHFTVGAYYGDPDYAEDGTKGDYVAVEVRPLWFYQDLENGIIGVSGGKQTGWLPHPVCVDEGDNIREKTYLPCYALAVNEAGDAVSLPGYHTAWNHYQGLRNTCRTYGGGNNAAHLEPMAVRHYEWLLFTIEFATTHCQSVMMGAASMPYSADDKVALDGTDVNYVVVTAAIGNKFVVGQTIYIGTTYSTAATPDALNIITAIEPCDPDGTPNESGTYRRITYSGRTNTVTAGTTAISTRPWITGSCNDVTTPSGSPVSNTSGKYPMRYRYRENIWANCNSTCNDLFDVLAGTGTTDDPYHIIWHHLIDPDWYPASSSRPNATDFASESFKQLAQITEHKDGYIKQIEADPEHPECIVPVSQTGGGSTTYFADYAYFVNGTTGIRSVRFGGFVYSGSYSGVLYFLASNPVSSSNWYYGGGLYFRQ